MKLLVLLVSNNEIMRRELLTHLAALDHKVILVSSDELTSVKDEFDLVLLDSELLESRPDILAKWKEHPYRYRAVVVVIPPSRMESVSSWLERGADDWILYPSHPLMLKTKLDQYVQIKLANQTTELAASFAHDIRPSLTSIDGFAELMKMNALATDDERQKSLSIIKRSAKDAIEWITDFVDYIDANYSLSRFAEPETMSIIESVESTSKRFGEYDELKHQSFIYEFADKLPTVKINEFDFYLIMLRLVKNISVWAADGSSIKISAQLEPSVEETNSKPSKVRFTIQYTGMAVGEIDKERIFHHWSVPLQHKYKRAFQLPIVKSQIEALGGEIWVEGTTDGSAFHFTLPVASSTP